MRHTTVLTPWSAWGSYYFTKVRYAGRFVHAEKLSG